MSEITPTLRDPMSMFDVKGKVAIITGASGAFGRATALTLGSMGAKLVLVSGARPRNWPRFWQKLTKLAARLSPCSVGQTP